MIHPAGFSLFIECQKVSEAECFYFVLVEQLITVVYETALADTPKTPLLKRIPAYYHVVENQTSLGTANKCNCSTLSSILYT